MKNYVFVQFTNASSDIVSKHWMVGEQQCRWPPTGSSVRAVAKQHVQWKDNWTVSDCEILCQASK